MEVLRPLLASALAASLLSIAPARAQVDTLRYDLGIDVAVTLAATAGTLLLASPPLSPGACRLCGAGSLDQSTRRALLWDHPKDARNASDLLINSVMPLGAILATTLSARAGGDARGGLVDALLIGEAVSVASFANVLVKDVAARRRPSTDAMQLGSRNRSFYSGHTSLAFSLATATATVSGLRGYEATPWIWGVGLTLASGVGFLRLAGDAHWLTDVAVGAVAGGAIGFAVPWLFHRRQGRWGRVQLVPAPGGLALLF